jgi:uncharacterized lipoprotein YddW (UPF0748 family)
MFGCRSSPESISIADQPPPAPREFRAAWVATVANIDWPSKPGLGAQQQQAEAIAILDRARELNLNAIVLQVRPSADALYDSKLEPWSYYLTGQQGKAPDPYYDPLKFWVEEAHKRGLELHAWFNPYRARHGGAKYPTAPNHISQTNPKIVKEFNNWQWLDPAEPEAQQLTYDVFLDVVRRYDVDGIHIDDYFYPYPDYLTKDKVTSDFPDDPAWQRYLQSGGGEKMSRDDWRRQNVNQLIERIYTGTKSTKEWVLFGISPFGISRPGRPTEVKSSFDQYKSLYADAELWLKRGWLDYWTPQLYWKIDSPQPYPALLRFWVNLNEHDRHVWPGLFTSRIGDAPQAPATRPADVWTSQDIVDQIVVTRETPGASGHVHFSMKVLMQNRGGVADALKRHSYSQPALVPASTWLDNRPPSAPTVQVSGSRVTWQNTDREPPRVWALWAKYGNEWRFTVLPGPSNAIDLRPDGSGARPSLICVSAVDRSGNESPRVLRRLPQ